VSKDLNIQNKLLNEYFVEDTQTVCWLGESWEGTERRLFAGT